MKKQFVFAVLALNLTLPVLAHDGHADADDKAAAVKGSKDAALTVKGEVIDMACYMDHHASGAKHADCAQTCIKSGLPVGLKGENGTTYLLIGDHKPMNAQLAQYAGKTITVRGKAVSQDGMNMIENAEVVQ